MDNVEESIKRGLEQSAAGDVANLGDFTQYADDIVDEILKHELITGPYFNIRCKCGYVGKEVSKNFDFERHLGEALTAAGYEKGK